MEKWRKSTDSTWSKRRTLLHAPLGFLPVSSVENWITLHVLQNETRPWTNFFSWANCPENLGFRIIFSGSLGAGSRWGLKTLWTRGHKVSMGLTDPYSLARKNVDVK